MGISKEIHKKFFTDTDETGRHVVISFRTGCKYYIEPIDGKKIKWGDLNPATGKIEGAYGSKYKGSISKKESLISEENGFENVIELQPGQSTMEYIEIVDALKPDKV